MSVGMSDVATFPSRGLSHRFRLRAWDGPRFARWLIEIVAVALLYYGAARLGYALRFAGPVAAIVWLPVGVAIAFLAVRGLSAWPGVLIGDLLANDYTTLPVLGALGQTCGNMLEVLVAASLVRRASRRGSPLDTSAGVASMVVALALGTALSATIGPLSLVSQGALSAGSIPTVFRTWWLGDFSGALVVVPLVLAWHPWPRHFVSRRRLLEALVGFAAVAALSETASRTGEPYVYLVFPALIWAAVRFGQRGSTLAVAVSVSVVVWSTTHYEGPFVFHSITRPVLTTQLFIVVASLSSLWLAALVSEKEAYAERLGKSRQEIFKAAEAERRRIERNLHDGAQQRLLALGVRLRLAEASARADGASASASTLPALLGAEQELGRAIDELRELSHGTHPSILTELGLADAVRSVAARSSVPVTITALPAHRMSESAEAAAYYVVTEAVVNAQRHGRASSVVVRVVSHGDGLSVEVSDDGRGGAVERVGSGLDGLRERVESLGGVFQVTSRPGEGTHVTAEIPG
jgi:signal transduction histidine kinase